VSAPKLTDDARALLTSWFLNGHHTSVEVGGTSAKSRLTERARTALAELEAAGFITSKRVNDDGRMCFQGTDKPGERLSFKDMEALGKWSPTEPNPDASDAARAKPTASIHLRSAEPRS